MADLNLREKQFITANKYSEKKKGKAYSPEEIYLKSSQAEGITKTILVTLKRNFYPFNFIIILIACFFICVNECLFIQYLFINLFTHLSNSITWETLNLERL